MNAPPPSPRRLPYVLLAALLVVAGTYQAWFSHAILRLVLRPEEHVRAPFVVSPFTPVIARMSEETAVAGLKEGDEVTAVGRRPYTGPFVLSHSLARSRPGDALTVTVRSPGGGATHDRTIRLAPRFEHPTGERAGRLLVVALGLVSPLFCLFLGFLVAALRPRDPLAWLLLLLLLSFSQLSYFEHVDLAGWEAWLRVPAVLYHTFFAATWPLWMMLFGIYFPARSPFDRRWPWAKWLLILPLGGFAVLGAMATAGAVEGTSALAPLYRFLDSLGNLPYLFAMAAVGTFFANLGHKTGTAASPDARRRLQLLVWGAQVSLSPMFLLLVASLLTRRDPFTGFSPWIVVPALLVLVLFPLTLAYVIVVQRALDVRVVVRQGLQYALARNAIRTLQVVATLAVIFFAATLAGEASANRPTKIRYMATGVMFVFLAQRAAERLLAFTDRRFFREAYDVERILADLGETVRTIVDTNELLDTVSRRIADALHVPRIATLLRRDGGYAVAHALGFGAAPPAVVFPQTGPTAARLRRGNEPQRVYLDDPKSWANREPGMEAERPALEALGSQLLLPFLVKDQLLGFMSLGPKQSEAPYSALDLRLLRTVAVQTSFALENSRLTAAVAAEVARRERMNRELEIAREVQEQLFPQSYPPVAGLDYAGRCRPALGVGGDYYDFLALRDGGLGIAIGDVSGKGIPAALLMAGLQASLRGQTLSGPGDLAGLMSNINRLIYDASPANRYATFFYAEYAPGTRGLRYVNAGHNAPMLFRGGAAGGEVVRLDRGGSVIGLLWPASYEEASVTLEPGDLLVAFTDGISEAMNAADEEWGEERLCQAVRACAGLTAAEVLDHVLRAADAFVAGAPQHDDMTLVVVRVVESISA